MVELTPLSPEWWVTRLAKALDDRQDTTKRLRHYYSGDHPLPVGDDRSKAEFKDLQKKSRSNWCGLVADAVSERMQVDGFRVGLNDVADAEIWRIWQANGLDSNFDFLLTEAFSTRKGYMLVWPDESDSSTPLVSVESTDQVIVEYYPGSRRKRAAAVKIWYDDWTGATNANLFLPDGLYKFSLGSVQQAYRWQPRLVENEPWPLSNPFGDVVPVVEFVNRQLLGGHGLAEFEDVVDIQDRVNETLFNRMIAVRTAAFRQKWVTGLEIPEDEDGNPIQIFESDITKLWWSENPDTKFGEFSESDISGYISSIESDIQHLAAITKTPPHYLLGQSGAFPSGDSLKATETGLVAKVRRRMRYFGESLEEVMALAMTAAGRPVSDGLQTVWADPESRSLAELTDAVLKQKSTDIPRIVLWEKLGYSPAEIDRMETLMDEQIRSGITSLYTEDPEGV